MLDVSKVPCSITLENTTNKDIRLLSKPGFSQSFVLPAGGSIKLCVETSSDLIGYLSQESVHPGLVVNVDEETEADVDNLE